MEVRREWEWTKARLTEDTLNFHFKGFGVTFVFLYYFSFRLYVSLNFFTFFPLCIHHFKFKSYNCKYLQNEVELFPTTKTDSRLRVRIEKCWNDVTELNCETRWVVNIQLHHLIQCSQSQEKRKKWWNMSKSSELMLACTLTLSLLNPLLMHFSCLRRENPFAPASSLPVVFAMEPPPPPTPIPTLPPPCFRPPN